MITRFKKTWLLGLFLVPMTVFGQKVPDPLEPAYILNLKKDTVKGYIVVINKLARQNQITFYSDPNDVKTRIFYDATKIRGYGVGDVFYESIPYQGKDSKVDKSFAIVRKRGKLMLYDSYVLHPHAQSQEKRKPQELIEDKDLQIDPLVRKGGAEVKNINTMEFGNFRKSFPPLVIDNRELVKKIENKELGRDDLDAIVDEYNSNVKRRR